MKLAPVIIAGGSGTRFWPLSRKNNPKQFLKLTGQISMLRATIERLDAIAKPADCFIATGQSYAERCMTEIPEMAKDHIIAEPSPRNTLPAITLAAVTIKRCLGDALLVILPSDHYIARKEPFISTINEAAKLAEEGLIVTLGITPTAPETGFGYIKAGDKLNDRAYSVAAFVEKPDYVTAQKYLASGNFFWNAGIFVMHTSRFFSELALCQPEAHAVAQKLLLAKDDDFSKLTAELWPSLTATSIDYGIMEKAKNLAIVPVECGWSDVGSWPALPVLNCLDDNGNMIHGKVISLKTADSVIFNDSEKIITTLGIKDLIIVATNDVILVSSKNDAQDVKTLVDLIKNQEPSLI